MDARKNFCNTPRRDKDKTILTFDNHGNQATERWYAEHLDLRFCFVYGNDFHAENLTFENTAGFTARRSGPSHWKQQRASLKNCRIVGNQDILFLSGSGVKHYFKIAILKAPPILFWPLQLSLSIVIYTAKEQPCNGGFHQFHHPVWLCFLWLQIHSWHQYQ